MMRILVTGAQGQLGQALQQAARLVKTMEWHFHGRADLDLLDEEMVDRMVRFLQPDVIINTAAYTAVDKAEEAVDEAFALNKEAVGYLAASASAAGAKLIHISTDYVYDNGQTTPYLETDKVQPGSVYAASKLAGEALVLNSDPRNVVIRTSWLYGPVGHNFLNTMLRLGRDRDELSIVFDQVGTPTCTTDLAESLVNLFAKLQTDGGELHSFSGIYNFSNEGVCSWYDFAMTIMRIRQIKCTINPIRSAAYPTPAKRPAYSVMDKARIKQQFGVKIAHWQDALERCMRENPGSN